MPLGRHSLPKAPRRDKSLEHAQESLDRRSLADSKEKSLTRSDCKLLPPTPALRREEIKLQVGLITPLIHVKGYAAPETTAAAERARLLIEQAQALGAPPEEPLLLFSVLYGFWVANIVAFNGDVARNLAAQFLQFAEKQRATAPLLMGHRFPLMTAESRAFRARQRRSTTSAALRPCL